jgi:hypothetical protein
MLAELKESLQHNVKERLSSPILGSYTFFFLAYNWKALALVFTSTKKGTEFVTELETVMPHNLSGVLTPALWTLYFVTCYPFLKLAYSLLIAFIRQVQIRYEFYLTRSEINLEILKEERDAEIRHRRNKFRRYQVEEAREDFDALKYLLSEPNLARGLSNAQQIEIQELVNERFGRRRKSLPDEPPSA